MGKNQAGAREEWRTAPDFPRYQVSSFGRVRSRHFDPPRVLKLGSDSNGYPTVMLSKGGRRTPKTVHRLVCRAFHGEPVSIWNESAHLDGVRANCRADNLRWVNKRENMAHKARHGTDFIGERHPRAKLSTLDAQAILSRARAGEPYAEIAEAYGVSTYTVSDISRGRRWRRALETAKQGSIEDDSAAIAQPHSESNQ